MQLISRRRANTPTFRTVRRQLWHRVSTRTTVSDGTSRNYIDRRPVECAGVSEKSQAMRPEEEARMESALRVGESVPGIFVIKQCRQVPRDSFTATTMARNLLANAFCNENRHTQRFDYYGCDDRAKMQFLCVHIFRGPFFLGCVQNTNCILPIHMIFDIELRP